MNEAGIACQIVGEPMLFDVLFTEAPVNNYRDVVNADANRLAIFNQSLRAQGIFKSPGKMYPSLALDEADLVQTEAAIAAAAKSLVV
jgi:glutamate-1-semialdehyde 2,1-aminomutase